MLPVNWCNPFYCLSGCYHPSFWRRGQLIVPWPLPSLRVSHSALFRCIKPPLWLASSQSGNTNGQPQVTLRRLPWRRGHRDKSQPTAANLHGAVCICIYICIRPSHLTASRRWMPPRYLTRLFITGGVLSQSTCGRTASNPSTVPVTKNLVRATSSA
jgi:hypothetical protein